MEISTPCRTFSNSAGTPLAGINTRLMGKGSSRTDGWPPTADKETKNTPTTIAREGPRDRETVGQRHSAIERFPNSPSRRPSISRSISEFDMSNSFAWSGNDTGGRLRRIHRGGFANSTGAGADEGG